jgi:hypothetical protein
MNYLCFHMYNPQEWYPLVYRGLEHVELALGSLGRRPLPADMIGREKVRVRDHWFPRDLEGITDVLQLRDAVHDRYARMMARARARSIRVAVSLEPESVPEAFRKRLPAWSGQRDGAAGTRSLVDDWQADWSGMSAAEADVRNPVVVDIAVERCLQCMSAFPDMDELHLISREGTAWRRDDAADYRAELQRLSRAFEIPPSSLEPRELEAVPLSREDARGLHMRAAPYWTIQPGEDLYPTVLGSLRFLELCRSVMEDKRVKATAERRGVKLVVTVYSPHPATVRAANRIVPCMLPPGARFHLLADYGAHDIAANMESWKPLVEGGLDAGLISWLEFDGNMMLCQGWTRSIVENLRAARSLGVRTAYFNHWRVRSLEHNMRAAAEALWDADRDDGEIERSSLAAIYGAGAVEQSTTAHTCLEEVTLFAKSRLFNVGFTGDWVFRNSTEPPGYDWADLEHAAGLYRRACRAFEEVAVSSDAAGASDATGRRQAEYIAALCGISADHLDAVGHLQSAKLPLAGYGAWPLQESADGSVFRLTGSRCPPPEVLERLCAEADQALALERRFMERYAPWVESCDEQGQLVMHHWGVIVPLAAFSAALRARLEEEKARRADGRSVPD